MIPAMTGPSAMPTLIFRSTPWAADSRATRLRQEQRHAREPRQVVGLRPADARDRHIAVADGLDLLHAMRRSQPVELGDDLIEKSHGARRAEPLG